MMSIIQPLEENELKSKKVIKQAILNGDSQVQSFFDDTVVFITGGSGFLGKQLIEKLFSSCNIRKIYLLLRPRKGIMADKRLNSILDDPVYKDLHTEQANFIQKIIPIQGDTSQIKMGIDENSWTMLANEVNVIFHVAATINFHESFKTSTMINVRGVREMLNLARDCKNLKSVVHVSTAYSHATRNRCGGEVKDDFYTCPIAPDTLIELAESTDEDKLTAMLAPLMREWPNTYTFTKAVAEELLRTTTELPVCIVRPAIVISAYQEPSMGWVDVNNAYGPSGLILGITLGILHTFLVRQDLIVDFVPVDVVNNATIVAAWATFKRFTGGVEKPIIYTVTGTRNPIYWRDMRMVMDKKTRSIVSNKTIWYCFSIETRFKLFYIMLKWLLHYIPGMVADGLCLLVGKKPRLLKIYNLIDKITSSFNYFLINDWTFKDENTLELYKSLSDTDKLIYNFDMSNVNIKDMILIWSYGVKKYIIKEDTKSNAYAIKKQFRFKIANYVLMPIYFYLLYKIIYVIFVFVYNVYLYLFA